ncbi:MAG: VOC family protein [Myxococcales bacterium]|nr:VOC family protein [Myxococcales bacterium]
MGLRLRQLAFAVEDLASSVSQLERWLGLAVAYRDPGVATYGLENAVFPIGDQFIELLSPKQGGTSAGRYIARRGGDCGYMAIFQSPDARVEHERITKLGVRVIEEIAIGSYTSWHYHPSDVGGVLLSVDSSADPASWMPAGDDWRSAVRTDRVSGLAAVEIGSPDPSKLAARWQELLGVPRRGNVLELDDAEVRFVDSEGRGAGIEAFAVHATAHGAILEAAARDGMHEDTLRFAGARLRLEGRLS